MQQELADGQVFEIKSNHLILKIYTKATFFESFFYFFKIKYLLFYRLFLPKVQKNIEK